jgi:hypothetical protein
MYGLDLPNLTAGNHTITSPQTPSYNCVSHAVYEDLVSLWPDEDNSWPASLPKIETVDAFVQLFTLLGFELILTQATGVTTGFEKIAIFATDNGTLPTHVARQCNTGRWTSKLGAQVDIGHTDLHTLEGGVYGYVVRLMRRRHTGSPPMLPDLIPPRPLIILPFR